MPKFSKTSAERLASCHPDLQRLFNEVIKTYDCAVLVGHRGEEAQNEAVAHGFSRQKWPNSPHNSTPSRAADVAPSPVDWSEKEKRRFYHFAGYVLATAERLGIKIRCGIDWNGNKIFTDDGELMDGPHFEIKPD